MKNADCPVSAEPDSRALRTPSSSRGSSQRSRTSRSRTNEHSRTNKLAVLYFIKWTSWHWDGVHVAPLFDWLCYFGFNPAGLGSV